MKFWTSQSFGVQDVPVGDCIFEFKNKMRLAAMFDAEMIEIDKYWYDKKEALQSCNIVSVSEVIYLREIKELSSKQILKILENITNLSVKGTICLFTPFIFNNFRKSPLPAVIFVDNKSKMKESSSEEKSRV